MGRVFGRGEFTRLLVPHDLTYDVSTSPETRREAPTRQDDEDTNVTVTTS